MATPDSTALVTGVDFVAQLVKDFDRAVAFYGDTLCLHRSVHVPDRGFAEVETGNLTLSLIDPARMGRGRRRRGGRCAPAPTPTRPPPAPPRARRRAPRPSPAAWRSPARSSTAA